MDIQKAISKINDYLSDIQSEYIELEEERDNLQKKVENLESENNDLNYSINYHMISQEEHNNIVGDQEETIKTLEENIVNIRETLEFVLLNKRKTTQV